MHQGTDRPRAALNRRHVIAGLAATGGLTLIGCGSSDEKQGKGAEPSARRSDSPTPGQRAAAMTVYRDPSCGCCEAWAEVAKKAGYEVALVDRPDMPAIKEQYRVPEALLSCHTTIVGGYAIEGHVPMEDVARLLRERPSEIAGIAVAGMPRGSPGMEMPDGAKDSFQVIAFDDAGLTSVYRS